MEIKKAKSQQQKLHRVNSILNAAELLFEQNTKGELPSAIQIANQASVAKGTLYIYFRTKEAIFIGVLERHLQNWIADFDRLVRQYDSPTCEDIVGYLTEYWQQNQILGELARLLDGSLILNVDEKVYSGFQTKLVNDLKRIIPTLTAINSDVDSARWQKLMLLSIELLTLAWQQSNPRKIVATTEKLEFNEAAAQLLTSFWQQILEHKKEQPKPKSTWRKLLGN
jgi:AcrR family transcriptional regulator